MQSGRVRRFAAGVALVIPVALAAQRSNIAPAVTAACGLVYDAGSKTPGTKLQRSTGSFRDEAVSAPIQGCRVIIDGSTKALGKQTIPTDRLSEMFEARGWQQLPEFSSDGHDGTSFGYKRERVACLVRGEWDGGSDDEPDAPLADPYRVTVLCGDAAAFVRLPRAVARAAAAEIEAHIKARVADTDAMPDEQVALERVLGELGAPLRVAQAYSADKNLDDAVLTGRLLPILRSIGHAAFTTVAGFFAALLLFTGYVAGIAFLVIGLAKPIFPNNVGFWRVNGPGSVPTSLGFQWETTELPAGGNWVLAIGIGVGIVILLLTHWGARAFLAWYRERHTPEFTALT